MRRNAWRRVEPVKRVFGPRRRIVNVLRARNDVVVAGEHQRLFVSEQGLRVRFQPPEPGELVVELLRGRGVAVGRINGGDADRLAAGERDRRLDIARLLVRAIARQRRYCFVDGVFRKERHAVERLLAQHRAITGEVLERAAREPLGLALKLLQAKHIRRFLLQPRRARALALLDRVDVPGCDLEHARVPSANCRPGRASRL